MRVPKRWTLQLLLLLSVSTIRNSTDCMSVPAATRTRAQPHHAKLAFLFIVRQGVPLEVVWNDFFAEAPLDEFRIYVHSNTRGFLLNATTTTSPLFYGRTIRPIDNVRSGSMSLVHAELRLLDEALEDIDNDWFIFVSDKCMPIFDFRTFQNYLQFSTGSYLEAYKVSGFEGRYQADFNRTIIPEASWSKGTQWAALTRSDATLIAHDNLVVPEMDRIHSLGRNYAISRFYAMDEHYKQVILANNNVTWNHRSVTFMKWSNQGHPYIYGLPEDAQISQAHDDWYGLLTQGVRNVTAMLLELQSLECHDTHAIRNCHLLARKFTPTAAELMFALVLARNVFDANKTAAVPGFFATENLDCNRFQDLVKASAMHPGECGRMCTTDSRCGGFAFITGNRYPSENCYPKIFAALTQAASLLTPGCVSLPGSTWYSRAQLEDFGKPLL